MPYEFVPMSFTLFLILGSWGLTLLGKNMRDKNRMREREMIHQERIQAMQTGTELPAQYESPATLSNDPRAAARWFRTVALGLGLFMLFGGVGICIAFSLAYDFRPLWTVGIIPALAGVGFLLFYGMSSRLESDFDQTGAS